MTNYGGRVCHKHDRFIDPAMGCESCGKGIPAFYVTRAVADLTRALAHDKDAKDLHATLAAANLAVIPKP